MGVSSVIVLVLCIVTIISDSNCQNNGGSSNLENKNCPQVTSCKTIRYIARYRCVRDAACYEGYKCCKSSCYLHKVCVIPVDKEGKEVVPPATTSSTLKAITTSTQRSSTQLQESTTTVLPTKKDTTLGLSTTSEVAGSGNGEKDNDGEDDGSGRDSEVVTTTLPNLSLTTIVYPKPSTTTKEEPSTRKLQEKTTIIVTSESPTTEPSSTVFSTISWSTTTRYEKAPVDGSGDGDDEDYGGSGNDIEIVKPESTRLPLTTIQLPKLSTITTKAPSTVIQFDTTTEATSTVFSTRYTTKAPIDSSGDNDDEDYGESGDGVEISEHDTTILPVTTTQFPKLAATTTKAPSTVLQFGTTTEVPSIVVSTTAQATTARYITIAPADASGDDDDEDYSGDYDIDTPISQEVTTRYASITPTFEASGDDNDYYEASGDKSNNFTTTSIVPSLSTTGFSTTTKDYTTGMPILDGSGDSNGDKEGDDEDYNDNSHSTKTSTPSSAIFNTTLLSIMTTLEERELMHASTEANESRTSSLAIATSEPLTVIATTTQRTSMLGYSSTTLSTNSLNNPEDDKDFDGSGDNGFEIDEAATAFSPIITTLKQESSTNIQENITAPYTTSGISTSSANNPQVEGSSTEIPMSSSTTHSGERDAEIINVVTTLFPLLIKNTTKVEVEDEDVEVAKLSTSSYAPTTTPPSSIIATITEKVTETEEITQVNTILPNLAETSSSGDFKSTVNQHTTAFDVDNSSSITGAPNVTFDDYEAKIPEIIEGIEAISAAGAETDSSLNQLPNFESAALASSKQALDSLKEGSGYDEDDDDEDNRYPEEE